MIDNSPACKVRYLFNFAKINSCRKITFPIGKQFYRIFGISYWNKRTSCKKLNSERNCTKLPKYFKIRQNILISYRKTTLYLSWIKFLSEILLPYRKYNFCRMFRKSYRDIRSVNISLRKIIFLYGNYFFSMPGIIIFKGKYLACRVRHTIYKQK